MKIVPPILRQLKIVAPIRRRLGLHQGRESRVVVTRGEEFERFCYPRVFTSDSLLGTEG